MQHPRLTLRGAKQPGLPVAVAVRVVLEELSARVLDRVRRGSADRFGDVAHELVGEGPEQLGFVAVSAGTGIEGGHLGGSGHEMAARADFFQRARSARAGYSASIPH